MPPDFISRAIQVLSAKPFVEQHFAEALSKCGKRFENYTTRKTIQDMASDVIQRLRGESDSDLDQFLMELYEIVSIPALKALLAERGCINSSHRKIRFPPAEHGRFAQLLEKAAVDLAGLDSLLQTTVNTQLRQVAEHPLLSEAIKEVISKGEDGLFDIDILVEEVWLRLEKAPFTSEQEADLDAAIHIWAYIRDQTSTFHPSDFCYLFGGDPFAGRRSFRDSIKAMLAESTDRQARQLQAVVIAGLKGFGKSHCRKLVDHTVKYINEQSLSGKRQLVMFHKMQRGHRDAISFVGKVFSEMGLNANNFDFSNTVDCLHSFIDQAISFQKQCWIFIDDLDDMADQMVVDLIAKLLTFLGDEPFPYLRMVVLSNRLTKTLRKGRCPLLDFDKLALLERRDVEKFVVEWRTHNGISKRTTPASNTDPRIQSEIDSMMNALQPPSNAGEVKEYHANLNQSLRERKNKFLRHLWQRKT